MNKLNAPPTVKVKDEEIILDYPEFIKNAAKTCCESLKKEIPDLYMAKYDSCGFEVMSGNEGASFQERMEMCIYIELLKAGFIK